MQFNHRDPTDASINSPILRYTRHDHRAGVAVESVAGCQQRTRWFILDVEFRLGGLGYSSRLEASFMLDISGKHWSIIGVDALPC